MRGSTGGRVDDICGEPCGFICAPRSETVDGRRGRIIEMSARMIGIVNNPILAVLLPVSCVVSISRRRD
jgi:hypothetical protein